MINGPPDTTRQPRPAPVYSPELAEAICARIAAGESLRSICRDRTMPSHDTLHRWVSHYPEFARMRAQARLDARTAHVRRRDGRRLTAKARRKQAWGRDDLYRGELGAEICRRLVDGQGLLEICADPAMPRPSSVYRWLERHADFAELYAQAREAQAHGLFDLAWEIARTATPGTVPLARLQFDVIRWRTARLAPKAYGERLGPKAEPVEVWVRKFGRGPDEPQTVFAGYF
jgi:hypothetical protein